MNFEFPDIADFPENVEDRFPDDSLADHLFQKGSNNFKLDLRELGYLCSDTMGLDKHENQIFEKQLKRILGSYRAWATPYRARDDIESDKCFEDIDEDGIYSVKRDTSKLASHLHGRIKKLLTSGTRANLKELDRSINCNDALTMAMVSDFLGPYMGAATKYRGGDDLKVRSVVLHVSMPEDQHHYQTFKDCKTAPKLLNLHVDPKPGVMKAMIYLSEVGLESGPFSYIRGSKNWDYDDIERIFAWGNSVGNYCHTPTHRRVANSLPTRFRKNAIIGRLVQDDTELSDFLLSQITQYTSQEASVMIFDPSYGFHRGGLCDSGTRVNLQVVIK
tara:strand:- start:3912 stop:4907 length:996 start_codon:yes stop_codon:yes gene_type:complete